MFFSLYVERDNKYRSNAIFFLLEREIFFSFEGDFFSWERDNLSLEQDSLLFELDSFSFERLKPHNFSLEWDNFLVSTI